MKNIFILMILLGLFSCKKDSPKPAQDFSTPTKYYPKGYYDIYVSSNFEYPYLSIERDAVQIYYMNKGTLLTNKGPLYYRLNCNQEAKYRAYSKSTKNSIDTTMYMLDNNPLWNRLVVCYKTDTLIDIIGHDASWLSQNEFYWNVK